MLAKIMGRTIEIPDERISGDRLSGGHRRGAGDVGAAHDRRFGGTNTSLVKSGGRTTHPTNTISYAASSPLIILLNHQIPSGKNAVKINRKGQRYPDKKFVIWRAKALEAIGGVAQAFPGPVHMIVDYVPGDNIRRDAPGMLDALCHLIEKAGIVADDKQVKSLVWREYPVQPKRARCSVSICDYQL